MLEIINSGQYCYFLSLIQCFSNNPTIRAKVQEHADAVQADSSKYYVFPKMYDSSNNQ